MVKVNIRDKNFISYDPSSCHKAVNKYIEWVPTNEPVSTSCFITDLCLTDVVKASGVKRKVAWILEPRSIHPHVYDWIEQNNKLFDYVLTFDQLLIDKGENYLYYPHGRCWIHHYNNEEKSKLCSTFASVKAQALGHRLRHQIVDRFKNTYNIDCFGGYPKNYIEKKEDGLNEYYFSVTIENAIVPGYWTEKLVDCFATKTIPIYWGDKTSVNKFFDEDGIIYFNTIDELGDILDKLTPELYNEKIEAVEKNFNLVEEYTIPEDWIYLNYPFLFD